MAHYIQGKLMNEVAIEAVTDAVFATTNNQATMGKTLLQNVSNFLFSDEETEDEKFGYNKSYFLVPRLPLIIYIQDSHNNNVKKLCTYRGANISSCFSRVEC